MTQRSSQSEANIQRLIMLALSEAGCLIWRNNTGAYTDPRSGFYIRYGVGGAGGADLLGLTPDGRFLAVEVKSTKGRVSKNQQFFIDAVNKNNGIAGVCRSAQDALDLINKK